jgi:hypothetical protein
MIEFYLKLYFFIFDKNTLTRKSHIKTVNFFSSHINLTMKTMGLLFQILIQMNVVTQLELIHIKQIKNDLK